MNSIIISAVLGVIMMFSGIFLKKNSSIAALAILAFAAAPGHGHPGYERVPFFSGEYPQHALLRCCSACCSTALPLHPPWFISCLNGEDIASIGT